MPRWRTAVRNTVGIRETKFFIFIDENGFRRRTKLLCWLKISKLLIFFYGTNKRPETKRTEAILSVRRLCRCERRARRAPVVAVYVYSPLHPATDYTTNAGECNAVGMDASGGESTTYGAVVGVGRVVRAAVHVSGRR